MTNSTRIRNNETVPTFGFDDLDFILAGDSEAVIDHKLKALLAAVKDDLDADIADDKASGKADDPDYGPNAGISIVVCYTGQDTVEQLRPTLALALQRALALLEEFDFTLADVHDWHKINVADAPKAEEQGVKYAVYHKIHISPKEFEDRLDKAFAEHFSQHVVGSAHGSSNPIEAILRSLSR